MDLNEIMVFVQVVKAGSFSGAAQQLEMPKSTVSAKVSALERRLGQTLIRRTTRRLFVTQVGHSYYQKCLQALNQIETIELQLSQQSDEPQGRLKITAPVELGGTLLPIVISEFRSKFAKVNLEVILTDAMVDLVAEGIDLALRAGELKDSTFIAKKLGTVYFAPFASPKYLKNASTLRSPKDLINHSCIVFTPLGSQGWQLHSSKSSQFVALPKSVLVNDLNLAKTLALDGLGLALLPSFFCQSELQSGKLVRVLNDWKSNTRPIHFVYPNQKFVPKSLNAFIELGTRLIKLRCEP